MAKYTRYNVPVNAMKLRKAQPQPEAPQNDFIDLMIAKYKLSNKEKKIKYFIA
jgi:hypothetical protein